MGDLRHGQAWRRLQPREGALNWEFFRLRIPSATRSHIISRGLTAIDPDCRWCGGGYFGNLNAGFVDMRNSCHGTTASAATDHVLSPALQPGM